MYGKHFEAMYDGSMFGAGPVNFAVWGYCIARAKPPGNVEINPPAVAAALGCTVDEVEASIAFLTSPDPRSRTKEYEGRRLVETDEQFLYLMPSWEKWNGMKRQADRREQNRLAAQRFRERKKLEAKRKPNDDAKQKQAESAHLDVDVDRDVHVDAMDGFMPAGTVSQESPPTPSKTRTGETRTAADIAQEVIEDVGGPPQADEDGSHGEIEGQACPNTDALPNIDHGLSRLPHQCPYQVEVKGNTRHMCQCCTACERACRRDI